MLITNTTLNSKTLKTFPSMSMSEIRMSKLDTYTMYCTAVTNR